MFVASIFGYNDYAEINTFITESFTIGIIYGAYSTEEVFERTIQSIGKRSFEGYKNLGLSKFAQFYKNNSSTDVGSTMQI